MPTLPARPVRLAASVRNRLKTMARGHKGPHRDRLRAQIVLDAARRRSNARIAAIVTSTRTRCASDAAGSPTRVWPGDLARSGRPSRLTPVQVAEVKALACQLPAETDAPLARWSHTELAREATLRGIVEAISPSTVRRWLVADPIKPWQSRSWISIRDPGFKTKASRVLDLYQCRWEGRRLGRNEYVICADEKPSIQARCRCHPTLAPGKRRVMRVEHDYDRGGALTYLAAYDVHQAVLDGRCVPSSGIDPFMALVEQVMSQEPVTVLPRTRAEDKWFRDWIETNQPQWTEAIRLPGERIGDLRRVWSTFPSPLPSAEGYRVVWVHSTVKAARDEHARHSRIEAGTTCIDALATKLASPKTRLKTRTAVEQAAAAALTDTGSAQWIEVTVSETVEETFRQEKRGRPGAATRYRRITRTRYTVSWHTRDDVIAYDAATDGWFPLITNDRHMSEAEVLVAYRYQPNLERRHHLLKSVQEADPIWLCDPARIEAIFSCQFLALLVSALIERQIRNAMRQAATADIPFYPELRACEAPSTERILAVFEAELTRVVLAVVHASGQRVQLLTDLRRLPAVVFDAD